MFNWIYSIFFFNPLANTPTEDLETRLKQYQIQAQRIAPDYSEYAETEKDYIAHQIYFITTELKRRKN